jgi:polyisoprenoid-binding protein YceI
MRPVRPRYLRVDARRIAGWLATLAAVLVATTSARAEPLAYKIDVDHSGVGFSIRHFVSNVPGRFTDFNGTIRYDRQNPAASGVELTVRAASIDTANNDRDDHLRSADFFDVEKFPTFTFTSTSVTPKSAKTFEVTGDITLRGVTKRITIPATYLGLVQAPRGEKIGFEATFTLNRKDFGISWNRVLDTAGAVLGDEVKITIEIEANRETEAPKAGEKAGEKPGKPPEKPPSGL